MWCCCVEPNDEVGKDMLVPLNFKSFPADEALPSAATNQKNRPLGKRSGSWELDGEPCFVYTVALHRPPDSGFGLDLSAAGRVCMINAVAEGSLVGDWNHMWMEKGVTEQIVQQHDRVVGINTERPKMGTDIMAKLRESIGQVTLVFQRPVRRKIAITRDEGKDFGITFVDGYSFLLVTSIAEGVIKDHNSSADSKDVIRLPSLIATVDGEKGSGSELFKRMQESVDVLEVEVLYYD